MKIYKVIDANVYVNGESKHGLASEVTVPDITPVMSDYKSMGMVGSLELPNGIDKMEAIVKWTYPDNTAKLACADIYTPVELMVRSSKAEFIGSAGLAAETPIVVMMRGYSKKSPGGTFKPKEDTELESTFALTYYKETVDGEDIVEVDVVNNIYKVGGEDKMAARRANLGI